MIPVLVTPIINPAVRNLCIRPYRNHTRGCPNFNKRDDCPPKAKLLHNIIDFNKPIYCMYSSFNLRLHIEKMREKHPNWSIYQLKNCLYWQGTARKRLRLYVEEFLKYNHEMVVIYCPEACGVDVTATMASIGITLEWPPNNITYQVAFCGYPINEQ